MQRSVRRIVGDPQQEWVYVKRHVTVKAWDCKPDVVLRKVGTKNVDKSWIGYLFDHANVFAAQRRGPYPSCGRTRGSGWATGVGRMMDKGRLNGTAERGAVLEDSMASRGVGARRRGGKTGAGGDRRSVGTTAGGRGAGTGGARAAVRAGSVPRGYTASMPREREAGARGYRERHAGRS